ncbi:MAG TPA: homoserine O-acetyltransferase [bacterium]|mgnify:CR=1 FL=1|nr:homoserine O-acetyltransferase [bacterium]HPP88006.1 homoserine O-acetyltransferase [bacterium]
MNAKAEINDNNIKFKDSVGIVEKKLLHFNNAEKKLLLDCGQILFPFILAYETYGQLNAKKDNVILIFHALSGDSHAAGYYSEEDKKPGWWDMMIGPGKAFDTNKYYVICSNVIGGCMGSTGPSSVNPQTGKPYCLTFPQITINDMVKAQKMLLDELGIKKLFSVSGGSMGGMLGLQFMINYPDMLDSAILFATTARLSAENIAFNAVGRMAITSDPNWNNGEYYDKQPPDAGLAVARMLAHITYLSREILKEKFDRKLQDKEKYSYDFNIDFQVESYLKYQGYSFVRRFDANSYLYITKAMDYFDLTDKDGKLTPAFRNLNKNMKVAVVSFTSDWLFPTAMSKMIVNALKSQNIDVTFCEVNSNRGHDAFLLEKEKLTTIVKGFLENVERK